MVVQTYVKSHNVADVKMTNMLYVVLILLFKEYASAYPGFPPCPQFMVGAGHGGTDEYVGDLDYRSCIQHCTKMRQKDSNVNGVTMPLKGKGCFCERNMRTIGQSTYYKTCYLKDLITFPLQLYFHDQESGPSISFPVGSCLIVRLKDARTGRVKHKQVKQFVASFMVPSGGENAIGLGYTMKMKVRKEVLTGATVAEAMLKRKCPYLWWTGKPETGDFVNMSGGAVAKASRGDFLATLKLQKM